MKIIVLGEIILDVYLHCSVNRFATEGKFPIFKVDKKIYKLGGASNVAINLKNLTDNILFITIFGEDEYTQIILSLLKEKNINFEYIIIKNTKNNIKTRILSNNIFYYRYDIENNIEINEDIEKNIFDIILKNNENEKINGIVLSDYNKGLLTKNLCQNIIFFSNNNNIITFIDPKSSNYEKYLNCTFFKPNLNDCKLLSSKIDLNDLILDIYHKINCKNLILTLASEGIIFYNGNEKKHLKHNRIIKSIDPTGAGDIVISILSYFYFNIDDIYKTLDLCNFIAGKSVEYIGNYECSKKDIDEYYNYKNNIYNFDFTEKILDINNLKNIDKNKKIGFTNGCFDILHTAHIKLLKFCKSKCDILIVGLNSDISIKNIKSINRPINNLQDRIEFLALLDYIDYIVIFDDDTPYNILSILKPNILIKGGDYKIDQLKGTEFVNEVIFFNYIENKSTSIIINKIENIKNIN